MNESLLSIAGNIDRLDSPAMEAFAVSIELNRYLAKLLPWLCDPCERAAVGIIDWLGDENRQHPENLEPPSCAPVLFQAMLELAMEAFKEMQKNRNDTVRDLWVREQFTTMANRALIIQLEQFPQRVTAYVKSWEGKTRPDMLKPIPLIAAWREGLIEARFKELSG